MTPETVDWIERAKNALGKGVTEDTYWYRHEGQARVSALIALAEEARGIKEELRRMNEREDDVARCPHGATGICMDCITRDDLLRPRT